MAKRLSFGHDLTGTLACLLTLENTSLLMDSDRTGDLGLKVAGLARLERPSLPAAKRYLVHSLGLFTCVCPLLPHRSYEALTSQVNSRLSAVTSGAAETIQQTGGQLCLKKQLQSLKASWINLNQKDLFLEGGLPG